jgi:N-methylhydantoinase A
MPVRIGVDVGGTFTKAVACDSLDGHVVAVSVVPTTHAASAGVVEGALEAIGEVAEAAAAQQGGRVELVAHSTTQAVNALLEGDTSVVGILAMGRRPDLGKTRKRTLVGDIRLAPGRSLKTKHSFLDVTAGLDESSIKSAIQHLARQGAEVVVASEAFGVDDARGEWLALKTAEELGIPACAGHELTGLYGLEMRTVTAALNAAILPTALRTARLVGEAAGSHFPGVPLVVMRGDGGVVNLEVMKRHPLLTAFSGPAASVAGALRKLPLQDAVVVEVGGTSTNIALIKGGRPVLSYVRVLDHVTSVRSLDVRVMGIAGGSLIRSCKRFGRRQVSDVGPRSAHIAGLPYACFEPADELQGARPLLISPRVEDPADYLVLETRRGRRLGVTLTCAANALGEVPPGSYARASDQASARTALEIAGSLVGVSGEVLARKVIALAIHKVAAAVSELLADHKVEPPLFVGLGGGAGALVPSIAHAFGAGWDIPSDAEVISSIGDAQSVVKVSVERSLNRASARDMARIHREAEEAAHRAGAAPGTIQIESESVPERSALRVTAFGAVNLESGAGVLVDKDHAATKARLILGTEAELDFSNEFFSVFSHGRGLERQFAVIDASGGVALRGVGRIVGGRGSEVAAALEERIPALIRHYGPVTVAPAVRLIRGARLIDLSLLSTSDATREAVTAECSLAHDEEVIAFLSRD